MKNLKIKVKNESESKEAKSLLESIGFDIDFSEEGLKYPYLFAYVDGMRVTGDDREDHFKNKNNKEITLPELRDLVVLKRNDSSDMTHKYKGAAVLKQKNNTYVFSNNGWVESCDLSEKDLELIEKTMKEYLDPRNGYKLIEAPESEALEPHASEWIEVPEGSTAARLCNEGVEFYKNDFGMFFSLISRNWINSISPRSVLMENIVWQRHTQPEGLPPTDDEPEITIAKGSELDCIAKIYDMRDRYDGESDEDYRYQLEHYISCKDPSLNDQCAEIEKVRESAWGVQVGGDHYKSMKIQPAKFALENKLDYCQANAIKYICRHESKNGKQDLEKAKHYIDLLIEHYYGNS